MQRAKRRRQRGAAMVEAAVIAVFMLMMFASLWAAVSYQAAKLRAMDDARHAAWAAALAPCQGGGDTLTDVANTTKDSGSGPLPSTQHSDHFLDVRAGSLAKDAGYVDLTRQRQVKFPKLMGGSTYEMRGRMYLRCNEPTPPETARDLFMTAVGVAKYTYGF
ncbi:MAG: hypothetical protein IT375_22455 [Polyangiaceae bacterium]|nr:hypothetical protein [Polyangiaceae bacterium]